jgi:hypothetical protein
LEGDLALDHTKAGTKMGVCIKYEIRTEKHLRNLLHYLGNKSHPQHLEYDIPHPVRYGKLTPGNFVQETLLAIAEINRRRRLGRDTENLATLFIDRFADGSDLSVEEEDAHEQAVVACVAEQTSAIVYRHRNTETGAIDFNFFVPNVLFDVYPVRTRRTNAKDPLATMRHASNASLEFLNEQRRRQRKMPIVRVIDRIRILARQRRGRLLEEELHEHGGVTLSNIKEVLEKLGHKVTRLNASRNTISIIMHGGKKATRYNLDELLDASLELPRELARMIRESTFLDFASPRDCHLRRLAGHSSDPPPLA